MFNIVRSIFIFAAASLFVVWLMNVHVSTPYVIGASTLSLLVDLSEITLEDARCLANVIQPAYDTYLIRLVFDFDSGAVLSFMGKRNIQLFIS